tara:strand:- start:263 stop:505 length:243 start_codon:yes stop_codon:yes gene_type:complete
MTSLTDRLRQHAQLHQHHTVQDDEQAAFAADLIAAAAEIERLREQVRVLREALESIKHDSEFFSASHLRSQARIALEKTK